MAELKKLVKDNLILFITFAVVLVCFFGYHIYKAIDTAKYNSYTYEAKPLEEQDYQQKVYESNQYKVITKTDEDLVDYYLSELIELWYSDPGALYDNMTATSKSYYESKDDFLNFVKEHTSSFTKNSTAAYYNLEASGKTTKITILTNENIEFILYEKGINSYTIGMIAQVTI